jgi:hypothetical protein
MSIPLDSSAKVIICESPPGILLVNAVGKSILESLEIINAIPMQIKTRRTVINAMDGSLVDIVIKVSFVNVNPIEYPTMIKPVFLTPVGQYKLTYRTRETINTAVIEPNGHGIGQCKREKNRPPTNAVESEAKKGRS